MRPACRLAASSVSSGPATLSTRSFISSAALVAASASPPVNDAALGLFAWSAPNTMIAGAGLGSGGLILACGLGFDLLVIVCCLHSVDCFPDHRVMPVKSGLLELIALPYCRRETSGKHPVDRPAFAQGRPPGAFGVTGVQTGPTAPQALHAGGPGDCLG